MKKALLCIITATITFFIGFYATVYFGWRNTPDVASDLASETQNSRLEVDWEELLKPVKPSLNADFAAASDKERDGLAGPVKSVRLGMTYLAYENGKYVETSRFYDKTIFYDNNTSDTF